MTLLTLVSLAIAESNFAAIPGPGVLATVSRSLASGFKPAVGVVPGIVCGDLIFLMVAIFGLSVVAQALGEFFIVVKIFGGIYLFWLGVKIWRSKPSETGLMQTNGSYQRYGCPFIGLLITLPNPKVILFYCGFLPTFIDLTHLNALDIVMIVCAVAFVLCVVLTAYASLASQAGKLLKSKKAIKRVHGFAGGLMMATGIAVATKT